MTRAGPAWRREEAGALVLRVHAQPGAKRTEVAGVHGDGAEARLKLRIAAPASDGKANDELRRFFAGEFGVPLRAVALVHGEASRQKTVRIAAPAARPDSAWAAEAGAR